MFLKEYQLILTPIAAWAAAQISKALIYFGISGKFRMERLFGNGGMPSSHSATVCSFSTVCFLKFGLSSFEFAMSFIFASVVLTDAMGVRLETGKQAKLLNIIIEENLLRFKNIKPEKRLKEFIGHTPFQVLVGSFLGIFIAIVIDIIVY